MNAQTRCNPSDLRLHWSSAYSQRRHDPAALQRLRRRVTATQAALADEFAAATTPAARAALSAEIAEVGDIAAAIARLDARGDAVAGAADGPDPRG